MCVLRERGVALRWICQALRRSVRSAHADLWVSMQFECVCSAAPWCPGGIRRPHALAHRRCECCSLCSSCSPCSFSHGVRCGAWPLALPAVHFAMLRSSACGVRAHRFPRRCGHACASILCGVTASRKLLRREGEGGEVKSMEPPFVQRYCYGVQYEVAELFVKLDF